MVLGSVCLDCVFLLKNKQNRKKQTKPLKLLMENAVDKYRVIVWAAEVKHRIENPTLCA